MSLNQGLYCWVDQDAVEITEQQLPQNWFDPNLKDWRYNLNNPTRWTDPQLLDIGWYPYILVDAGSPGGSRYYTRSLGPYQIQPTEVVQTASYAPWDIEEMRTSKNQELESQVRQYSLNDEAINSKVKQYIQDDSQWLAEKQAELAALETWQEVADFDTAKPNVIAFSNNYVGQRYVKDGYRLSAENRAATDSGQPEIWSQTLVNNFVTSNQNAAGDTSGNTPPVPPTFELRQGIANPNEQAARVIIFRAARDDPNPALRQTYKMRLLNRAPWDNRPLYIFSYTNSTYLTWRLFEDLGNGVWGLEATAAEWQYVPSDMKFRFSYSTNPAVESELFTDDVLFPAGVQKRNILVTWDP